MQLSEALAVLGVERVKKGMRAIDDRRDPYRGKGKRSCARPSWCETCFIGEAFGGTREAYDDATYADSPIGAAARFCESYYEGRPENGVRGTSLSWDRIQPPPSRATLREACITYLAENGTAIEAHVQVQVSESSVRG